MVVRRLLVLGLLIGCGSSPAAAPPEPEPEPEPDAAAPRYDAGKPTPLPDASALVPDTAPPPPAPDAAAADAAPPPADAVPAPLGEFPLASVRAARPEKLVTVATPCEGPSWIDGEIFFGFRDGLMRISRDRKLYRYLPELAFSVGTYKLGDGTLLVCDRANKLVRVLRDGKVEVLADAQATNSNDVTIDASGNIYFSDFRTAIFRITPGGEVSRALAGLDAPNGVEVDPASRFLYFISGSRLMRAALPAAGAAFGPPELAVTLPGGGDGCAFDDWGNLWVAIYAAGQLAVVDVAGKRVITSIGAGGTSVTNLTFGGPGNDEVFTTVASNGVYRIPVGARGFRGHRGADRYTPKKVLDTTPANTPVP
jgi:sugar lactone lactonase YvrE